MESSRLDRAYCLCWSPDFGWQGISLRPMATMPTYLTWIQLAFMPYSPPYALSSIIRHPLLEVQLLRREWSPFPALFHSNVGNPWQPVVTQSPPTTPPPLLSPFQPPAPPPPPPSSSISDTSQQALFRRHHRRGCTSRASLPHHGSTGGLPAYCACLTSRYCPSCPFWHADKARPAPQPKHPPGRPQRLPSLNPAAPVFVSAAAMTPPPAPAPILAPAIRHFQLRHL
jgi:hypothetical protein